MHPLGGAVHVYQELADLLGPDQPFFALQDEYRPLAPDLPETLEAMAERYAAAIRTAAPDGPVALGGWSFGGVVALAVANALASAGRQIRLVALFDSHLLDSPERVDRARHDAMALRAFLSRDPAPGAAASTALPDPIAALANQISASDLALVAAAQGPRYLAHLEAWVSHVPQPGRHRLVMFRAAGPAADSVDGWRALSGQPLEIVPVPGEHATLLGPPHAGTLARRLAGFLSGLV